MEHQSIHPRLQVFRVAQIRDIADQVADALLEGRLLMLIKLYGRLR
jgi:hypothetical protein